MQIPDNLLPVATLLGALGIGGWIGSYLTDRRRARQDYKSSLRQAYARWYTSITLLAAQVNEMMLTMRNMPDEAQRCDTAYQYVKALLPRFEEILASSTEILFQERQKDRRRQLLRISRVLERWVALTQKSVSHARGHVEARKEAERVREELLQSREELLRTEALLQRAKEFFQRAEEAERTGSFSLAKKDDIRDLLSQAEHQSRGLLSVNRDLLSRTDALTERVHNWGCAINSLETMPATVTTELARRAAILIQDPRWKR